MQSPAILNLMTPLKKITAPEIKARIQKEAPKDALWIFDCDGTLIKGDIASMTAWALIRFGIAHAELLPDEYEEFRKTPFDYSSFRSLRKLVGDKKGSNSIYEWEAFLHAGVPVATSYDMAKLASAEGFKIGAMGLTGAVTDLATANAKNAWIVSGSPEFCVWSIADQVQIPHERVIGTRLETVDGILAPRIIAPGIIWEELKRTALRDKGVQSPYFVAGDTIGDWQMMEMSTRWCWALVWDHHRHRGEEMREVMQTRILNPHQRILPKEPGFYLFESTPQNWVIEVRHEG